jgi:acetyl-CoA carboxylase biotin carboxyl carrier protein
MFKMHELRELIRLIDQSTIQEFELESDGTKVNIKKAIGRTAQVAAEENQTGVSPVDEKTLAPAPGERVSNTATEPESKPVEDPKPVVEAAENKDTSNLHKIVSPMVGSDHGRNNFM